MKFPGRFLSPWSNVGTSTKIWGRPRHANGAAGAAGGGDCRFAGQRASSPEIWLHGLVPTRTNLSTALIDTFWTGMELARRSSGSAGNFDSCVRLAIPISIGFDFTAFEDRGLKTCMSSPMLSNVEKCAGHGVCGPNTFARMT